MKRSLLLPTMQQTDHHPEITLDTVNYTPEENVNFIVNHLIEQGLVRVRRKIS